MQGFWHDRKKTKEEELRDFWENSYPALFSDTLADRNFRLCSESYTQRDRCGTFWADIDYTADPIW